MKSSDSRYDAIVIGAGIAGMMAASQLNHRRRRVLVLEHNHQAGGLMAGIRRKGYYFDAGCQSFENMGIVFPLLEQTGLSDVAKFRRVRYRLKMPEIDTIVESLQQTRRDFVKAYPSLEGGLNEVFDVHDSTSALVKKLFVPEAIPYVKNEHAWAFLPWLARGLPWAGSLKKLMFDDFTDWYKTLLPCEGADGPGALLAQCGYTRMNVFVASAFWHLWAEDYWYPEGGYGGWFENWVRTLEARGAEFLFKRTVTGLEKKDERAVAVLTSKGERFAASQIVYCGDYKEGMKRLIGSELYGSDWLNKLGGARHSDALVSVYLGLNLPAEKLKEYVRSSHIFYFPNYGCKTALERGDEQAHAKAFLEVTAHCVEQPDLNPPGRSSVVLQAFTEQEWLENWRAGDQSDDTDRAARTFEYKDVKRKVAEQLITTFEGIFPDVRKFIEYVDVGSPLSTVRFTRNHRGGSCGFELNWRNFPFINPLAHIKTPLRNVHMAGHFTVWPGAVPTAALSGKIAALAADRNLK